MVYVFALLFLLSMVAAFVGLVKPSLFKPDANRWKVFGIGMLVSFISLGLTGMFAPEVDKKPETVKPETVKAEPAELKAVEADAQVQPTPAVEQDLGLSAEQFRLALNKDFKAYDISYLKPVDALIVQSGEVNDTFELMFTDAVGLVGTLNKSDKKLQAITIVYAGNSEDDLLDLSVVLGTVSKIVAKKDSAPKEIIELVMKSIRKPNTDFSAVIDQVNYKAYSSETTGTLIILTK